MEAKHYITTLFWVILLSLLAAGAGPAFAQSLNPPVTACGLPTSGVIRQDVTYTLTADCTQTARIDIARDLDNTITVTINGGGHRIIAAGNFKLITVSTTETLNLNNVTFDGNYVVNREMVSVEGNLTANQVTFSKTGAARALFIGVNGTATLNDVLFEANTSGGFNPTQSPSALDVRSGAVVSITNSVYRDNYSGGGAIHAASGTTTLNGCLTFSGNIPADVIGGLGWVTDNSTGPCSGSIGNGGTVSLPAQLPAAACGLPASGNLDVSATYVLMGDCAQTGLLQISDGVNITINGNGHSITRAPPSSTFYTAINSTLTLRNVIMDGARLLNWGTMTAQNVTFRNMMGTIYNEIGNSQFTNVVFENNVATGANTGSAIGIHPQYNQGEVTIRDSIFRNHSGGAAVIVNNGGTLTLSGCILFQNNLPGDYLSRSTFSTFNDNRIATPCDAGRVPFTPISPFAVPVSAAPPTLDECTANGDYIIRLGAIGLFCRSDANSWPGIEIYAIDWNSQGSFALSVTQAQVDAIQPYGEVARSADGRIVVRVWEDRNITISMGPNWEGKIHHVTLAGHLNEAVIETVVTYDGLPGTSDPTAEPAPPRYTAPPAQRQPARAGGSVVHVVRSGDTIHAIAVAYGVDPREIIDRNRLADGHWIFPGQELVIRDATSLDGKDASLPAPVYAGDDE